MDIKFNSEAELYERLKPALRARRHEFERLGMNYVAEEDIWNYLKEDKWKESRSLSLSDMVNMIMSCEEYELDKFIKRNIVTQEKVVNLEEEKYEA